ncbi:MAG: EutN/CcmL family microcompartment protein [Planctomycetota bacterium]
MNLGTVVGTVVTPVQHDCYAGRKLLLVRPEDPFGKRIGRVVVAIDHAQAGVGDRVLLMAEGSSARDLLALPNAPVRSVVVGVVDEVEVQGKLVYRA